MRSRSNAILGIRFQHTAARRRLGLTIKSASKATILFQHTAARRRLGYYKYRKLSDDSVSTHSRPKAAGGYLKSLYQPEPCFNTQPPEGGWLCFDETIGHGIGFNTQPPEGGWFNDRRGF